jgi:prepilin-type N-terminal cleavage/methylation domain-containing protein
MNQRTPKSGFTLIELIVVISVLAILSGVLVPRIGHHLKSARDARRLEDVKTIHAAIDQYFLDKGSFPAAVTNPSYGGWDVSHDGDFISDLRDAGYLEEEPKDPINDATFHYRYYLYGAGSYGCVGSTSFYVLGVKAFESPDFAAKNKGFFKCASRNWSDEFAYVTGGGATFE